MYPWTEDDDAVARETLKKIHAQDEKARGATALVIAPTGLPGMWHHMDRQLRGLGYATIFPGVESVERIFNLIERLRPRLIISLPLVLSRLGEIRAQFSSAQLAAGATLFSGGDVISESRRARIESMWDAKLKNFYGLSEAFGPLAGELDDRATLAWQADLVRVEILNPATNEAAQEGETGVAVITTLWERPASLVRYWTGDRFRLIRWLDEGRPLFQMRGREQMRLLAPGPGVFAVDVGNIILADPAAGNEWAIKTGSDGAIITVETAATLDAFDHQTLRNLERLFRDPVRLKAVATGALSRGIPKLEASVCQPE